MNKTLIQKFAERFSVDSEKVIDILKATAFRQKAGSAPVTDEQMMALMIVADQYSLNPFTREIYIRPDTRQIFSCQPINKQSEKLLYHVVSTSLTLQKRGVRLSWYNVLQHIFYEDSP
ncbi:MAG: recombinase RecT [Gallionellaceae bacterium]